MPGNFKPCIKNQILSTSIRIFCLSSNMSVSYGVPWASSISSHPMRDWIAPSAGRPSVSLIYSIIKLLIALQNLFLLKLFGIGNYLTLIYLSTGREYGLISS